VTILDDGVERSHPDLQANYDPLASFDVNQGDNDPTPRYDLIDSNRHGEKKSPLVDQRPSRARTRRATHPSKHAKKTGRT